MTLYSTGCPQCGALKAMLDAKKYKYVVCDDVEKMLSMGLTAVPILEVNDQLMSFKEAVQWINQDGGDAL